MKRRMFPMFIIFLFVSQFVIGQNLISGNVIRVNKKPLTGVKVTIEGVNGIEETTDQLGNFDIEVPLTAKVLVFSYEGMKTQKIELGKKSFISVTMIEGKNEPSKAVVKKTEKPKENSKAASKDSTKKNESSKTKETTKTNKKTSKETPDSTAKNVKTKESKPKEVKSKESKPKESNKEKEKTKTTKTSKDKKPASDSTEVKETKTPSKTTKDKKSK